VKGRRREGEQVEEDVVVVVVDVSTYIDDLLARGW